MRAERGDGARRSRKKHSQATDYSPDLHCAWHSWIVLRSNVMGLLVPEDNLPDMRLCLVIAAALMPTVHEVRVIVGKRVRVIYVMRGDEWCALDAGAVEVIAQAEQAAKHLEAALPKKTRSELREERAANARKLARDIHDDPMRRALWMFMKRTGDVIYELEKLGKSENAQQMRYAQARLKMQITRDPQAVYQRIVAKNPRWAA